jgi:hypothetical protein
MTSQAEMAERGERARHIYDGLKNVIETPDRIGQLIVIDPDSGDYEIGGEGIEASHRLQARHPQSRLFALRIGYRTVDSFAGMLERNEQRQPVRSSTSTRSCP